MYGMFQKKLIFHNLITWPIFIQIISVFPKYPVHLKYTMKHILIKCTDLAHIRKTFYSANNMKELFQNTEINNVISILKTVKLYTKI